MCVIYHLTTKEVKSFYQFVCLFLHMLREVCFIKSYWQWQQSIYWYEEVNCVYWENYDFQLSINPVWYLFVYGLEVTEHASPEQTLLCIPPLDIYILSIKWLTFWSNCNK